MKEKDVEGYLTRQMGISPAMWEEIANGAANGAKSAFLYFNALINQGFTREAALKIICAHGCAPKWPWDSTTTRNDEET